MLKLFLKIFSHYLILDSEKLLPLSESSTKILLKSSETFILPGPRVKKILILKSKLYSVINLHDEVSPLSQLKHFSMYTECSRYVH